MPTELTYDVCPETGIGCVLVRKDDGMAKFDLMPDEVACLESLAASRDAAGIRALLANVSATKAAALDDDLLKALIENAR